MLQFHHSRALGQTQAQINEACDQLIRQGTIGEARELFFALGAVFTAAVDNPRLSAQSKQDVVDVGAGIDDIEQLMAKFIPTASAVVLEPHRGQLCSAMSLANVLAAELRDDPVMAEQAQHFQDVVDLLRFRLPDEQTPTRRPGTALIASGVVLALLGAATWSWARREG